MKTFITGLVIALALSGCGMADRVGANVTGYSTTCVDGLAVVQMASGAFYKRDVNDKLIPCK